MEPSNSVINPSGLPMRLERFKTVCVERRKLKGHINKLIQRREALAVQELECAERELRKITADAKDIRAQMEETRLAEVGGRPNSEGAMSYTSSGPFDAATLFKTAGLERDGPLPPDTLVAKGSARNSPSFKYAESPIVLPTSDGGSLPGTPVHSPFKLDPRSEDCTPTIPIAGEDGQSCDLKLQARRYAELCEERRALEMEIEGRLAEEEKTASMRVESARSSLRAVREEIAEIRAGLKRASAGDTTANTGDTMETPGDTMGNVGDTMGNPGDTMENPGDTMENSGDTMENARDTIMNIPPTVSNDVPHGGDGLEDTHTPASTIHPYSSEARVNPSPSISDASTHNKSRPSLHVPESSRESHLARRALQSPEETLATGSQITSTYKTRKKLTKKGHKQIERPRVVSHDSATPWVPRSIFPSVGGE